VAVYVLSKPLNAFLVGETYAASMGVNIRRFRVLILLCACALAGMITSVAGPVAFIGLAVPHMARLIFQTSDNRILIPGACLVGALVAGGFWHLKREQRWQTFLDRLNDQSGVVVTRVEKKGGVHHIFGLRDPLSVSPQEMLAAADLPSHKVAWHWRAYHDLAPEMVLARIRGRLKPPKSVRLDLEGARLQIQGFARHNWIVAARQALAGMPAVVAVDSTGLKDLDLIEAQAGAERLAAKAIYFSIGAFEIDANSADVLVDVVATIRRLTTLSLETGIDIFISILGHTDESGTRQKNLVLGQRRAEVVREHLILQGIPTHHLQAIGVSRAMEGQPSPSNHPDLSRSVRFQVAING
jgi:outer membrane protein OmpA-like peptidoglycan-associated protein